MKQWSPLKLEVSIKGCRYCSGLIVTRGAGLGHDQRRGGGGGGNCMVEVGKEYK